MPARPAPEAPAAAPDVPAEPPAATLPAAPPSPDGDAGEPELLEPQPKIETDRATTRHGEGARIAAD